ncbi:hypothetical protein PGTUg99_004491 [Puccinia graminis f. sp. tritici]|uniref:Uncharacterized protein n=1 Tax=Puccinia graminis f. sp. tritici TaxID=56615 RepID=A0A5B0P7W4_PUCGR|nr:hypothetical protein PGTUg99_004491 [Puccinia graminis f. sp. tritici]
MVQFRPRQAPEPLPEAPDPPTLTSLSQQLIWQHQLLAHQGLSITRTTRPYLQSVTWNAPSAGINRSVVRLDDTTIPSIDCLLGTLHQKHQ